MHYFINLICLTWVYNLKFMDAIEHSIKCKKNKMLECKLWNLNSRTEQKQI